MFTMKPVTGWGTGRFADAFVDCVAARQKYVQLGREIDKMSPGVERDNADHTHSKLGIFLTNVLGHDWTEWLTGDPDKEMKAAGL